jgi:hypothetical protein
MQLLRQLKGDFGGNQYNWIPKKDPGVGYSEQLGARKTLRKGNKKD